MAIKNNHQHWILIILAILLSSLVSLAGIANGQRNQSTQNAEDEVLRLLAQAQKLKDEGKYEAAMPLTQRAVSLAQRTLGPDHLAVAMALNRLASLYQAKGDYSLAEPLFQRSLGLYEKALGSYDISVAQSLNNLALLYSNQGQYQRAEPLYQRAIKIYEKVAGPEHPDTAALMNNLSELYRLMGAYNQAEQLSQRVSALSEKTLGPQHPQLGIYLSNLATIYIEKGEYVKAEPFYQRAIKIYVQAFGPEHPHVATLLNNLGLLSAKRGDYKQAEILSQQALTIYEKTVGEEHPALVPALNNLASISYVNGQDTRAEALYKRALAIREKTLGPEHPDVATSLNNLALLYFEKGDYLQAESLYQRALKISENVLGTDHPQVARSLHNLAAVYRVKGDYQRAETFAKRAVAIAEKALGPEHPDLATYLLNLAQVYGAKGQVAQAISSLTRGNDIREHHLGLLLTVGSEEQKLSYMATLAGETDATITLHTRRAPNDQQAARLALITILRRKGRVLDVMSESLATLRRRFDAQDKALLEKLLATRSQLAALALKSSGKSAAAQDQALTVKLLVEADQLEKAISSRSAEFRVQSQPITLERVQEALPAGAALVEIVAYQPYNAQAKRGERSGAERYAAYVLPREGAPMWVDIGEAAPIKAEVAEFRRSLTSPHSPHGKEVARKLDEKIMRPVRKLLGDVRRIFLSPDGDLNLIPFGALIDEQNRYLVESYTITYLTSGRDLLRLQVNTASKQPPLILANPLFEKATPANNQASQAEPSMSSRRSSDLTQAKFNPLPGTAEEAQALSTTVPGVEVKTGAQATEAALKQVQGPRVLHIATHGFFLPDQPQAQAAESRGLSLGLSGDGISLAKLALKENPLLRSGIALAGANQQEGGAGEDGILTALEASGLDLLGTKLVVLSACETGIGEVDNSNGVYGLRRALVLAGSESQVMSLWQVSDLATRDLMVEYYQGLQAGAGRTEALRQVQLGMIRGKKQAQDGQSRGLSNEVRSKGPEWSHPFYWASFIQSGDWRSLDGKDVTVK